MDSEVRRQRLLIMEEDDEWRDLLSYVLLDNGYEVRGAKGIVSAWRALERWPCHAVLGADRLGELDGFSCLKALKERYPQVKCIVLVSNLEDCAELKTCPEYLSGVIYKPVDLGSLHCLLQNCLQPRFGWFCRVKEWGRRCLGSLLLKWRSWQLSRAEGIRRECFEVFWESVRSGGLLLGGALAVWDGIEELEFAKDKVLAGKLDGSALKAGYRYLCESMGSGLRLRCISVPKNRDVSAVNPQVFSSFFNKVRRGDISLEMLRIAPALRRSGKAAGTQERRSLFDKVWGLEEQPVPPWAGARKALEEGTGVWQSKSLKLKKLATENNN